MPANTLCTRAYTKYAEEIRNVHAYVQNNLWSWRVVVALLVDQVALAALLVGLVAYQILAPLSQLIIA